jgi:hypothetical protein
MWGSCSANVYRGVPSQALRASAGALRTVISRVYCKREFFFGAGAPSVWSFNFIQRVS